VPSICSVQQDGQKPLRRSAFEPREIASMIKVPVSKKNDFDGWRREAKFPDKPPDENWFAKQFCVNHHVFAAIFQQKTTTHDATNGI
jgi:hypothetical protein